MSWDAAVATREFDQAERGRHPLVSGWWYPAADATTLARRGSTDPEGRGCRPRGLRVPRVVDCGASKKPSPACAPANVGSVAFLYTGGHVRDSLNQQHRPIGER